MELSSPELKVLLLRKAFLAGLPDIPREDASKVFDFYGIENRSLLFKSAFLSVVNVSSKGVNFKVSSCIG